MNDGLMHLVLLGMMENQGQQETNETNLRPSCENQPSDKSSCDWLYVDSSNCGAVAQHEDTKTDANNDVDFTYKNKVDKEAVVSDKKIKNEEPQEKAVSLSALESNSSSQQGLHIAGKGTKNTQVFS